MYFCIVSCNLFLFVSNCINFILFSFFLMILAEGFSILIIFSKKQLLVLLIFIYYCFFHFSFIYFCSNLYDSFPSTDFAVLLLLPVALGVELGSLFAVPLVPWGRVVLLWNPLLDVLLLHPIDFALSCFHCHFPLEFFKFPFQFLQ